MTEVFDLAENYCPKYQRGFHMKYYKKSQDFSNNQFKIILQKFVVSMIFDPWMHR